MYKTQRKKTIRKVNFQIHIVAVDKTLKSLLFCLNYDLKLLLWLNHLIKPSNVQQAKSLSVPVVQENLSLILSQLPHFSAQL